MSYFLFCTSTIEYSRETYYCGCSVCCKPRKWVHNKCKVCLRFWSKNSSRSKSWIIYKFNIIITRPFNWIRWIWNYSFKWFFVPVLWWKKCVVTSNVKLIIINIMQEHVNSAKVVCCKIYFLTKKALTDFIFS